MKKNEETKNRILDAAKEEFMTNGFSNASMRTIAEKAKVTTGAVYNSFKDKAELFDMLVKSAADELYNYFYLVQNEFALLSDEKQTETIHTYTEDKRLRMIDIIYNNLDAFKLIITKSTGSIYEYYPDRLVEIEVANTWRFIDVLKRQEKRSLDINENLIHILSSALFEGVFEPVAHNMTKEDAVKYVSWLFEFFDAGWEKMLGV